MRLETYLNRRLRAACSKTPGIFENARRLSLVSLTVFHASLLSGLVSLVLTATASGEEPNTFKTGKALQTALSAKISWSSVGLELGDQLRDLQYQTEVVILRDRRIDPHRRITVKTDFVPRIQVLSEMSATIPEGAFCLTENFVFVGPAAAAHRLPILLDRNNAALSARRKKFDNALLRKLTANVDASWEQLAEPRQILLNHAKTVGVVIRNPDTIPHDVWGAGRLPNMSFVELATVILNQFDQTFQFADDRNELMVIPINDQEPVEHRYIVGTKLKPAVTAAWQSRAPDIDLKWTGSTAIVTTTLPQHAVLNTVLQELQYSATTADSGPAVVDGSLRTRGLQIKADRATIGQVVEFFRREKVAIEVIDENSPETQAILRETVQLDKISEKMPGSKLFPLIFGKHFKSVDVRDDRVVLSTE